MPRESFAQGQQVTPADRLRPFLPASTLTPRPAPPATRVSRTIPYLYLASIRVNPESR